MDRKAPLYSFVVTIYNDAYLAEAFCVEFRTVFETYLSGRSIKEAVELIFVNDGSADDSWITLRRMASEFDFVKVIDLSKNFGQHTAILCGYHHATGSYVGRLNVDMQDPPSEIPKLLDCIQKEDVDMVVGIQRVRRSKWLDIVTARIFFWLFNALTGSSIPQSTATLRVMNRRIADAFQRVNDKFPFIQGLETWFGFKIKYLETEHVERADGKSSYTAWKRLKLAIDASISFSDRPLKMIVSVGFVISFFGFLGFILIVLRTLINPNMLPGYSSTISVLLFLAGVQILVIGLSGLYIGKILTQVQDRPTYLIREKINFAEPDDRS